MARLSPARAHMLRMTAAREQRAAGKTATATGTMAERMAALLRMHQAHLKTIKSRTAKIAAKRGMLPDYAPYIDGVLAAGNGAQDDVVTTVMLWRLDVGDWSGALDIAAYGIRHRLAMPAHITRDLPTTLVEEMADAALAAPEADAAMAGPLQEALDLTEGCDMPDEVRAKAHKALGRILRDADAAQAAQHLETALTLDPGCGVKTELTRLKKALGASAPGAGQSGS